MKIKVTCLLKRSLIGILRIRCMFHAPEYIHDEACCMPLATNRRWFAIFHIFASPADEPQSMSDVATGCVRF